MIKSKNSQFKVTIPYHCRVLKGELKVNESATIFHLKDENRDQEETNKRNLTVENRFSVPVAVHKISLDEEASEFVSVDDFVPVILGSGQKVSLAHVVLKPQVWKNRLLNSHLTLHTNISHIDVPLICFHGKLDTV